MKAPAIPPAMAPMRARSAVESVLMSDLAAELVPLEAGCSHLGRSRAEIEADAKGVSDILVFFRMGAKFSGAMEEEERITVWRLMKEVPNSSMGASAFADDRDLEQDQLGSRRNVAG